MKVLLTGGSGFMGRHILDCLLKRGHEVVFTVRSEAKAQEILKAYPNNKQNLSSSIVPDMSKPGAFDKAVQAQPSFDAILHSSSPFNYVAKDPKADMIDPAIHGTTEILRAAMTHAPAVKRIVVTSSFAAVINMRDRASIITEKSWNPITMEEALTGGGQTYVGSKKFAEKAAWDFMKDNKPGFILSTVNPVLVFGPVLGHLRSLANINTSNQIFADAISGKWVSQVSPNSFKWVDVRDVALIHVRAIEIDEKEASERRFIASAGNYSNGEVAEIIKKTVPEVADRITDNITRTPGPNFEIDTSPVQETLGIQFRSLEESVEDTAKSLLKVPV